MSDQSSVAEATQENNDVITIDHGSDDLVKEAHEHASQWVKNISLERYANEREVLSAYRGMFNDKRTALKIAPEIFESLFENALASYQETIRERVRNDALTRMRSVIGGAITEADLDIYSKLLSERSLEEGGAISHEMKVRRMHSNVSLFIEKANAAKKLGDDFKRKLEKAVEQKWISKELAKRKNDFMFGREHVWSVKQAYISFQFNSEYRQWEELAKEANIAKQKAKAFKGGASIPEVKALLSTNFSNKSIEARRSIIDFALAAMAAHETNRRILYRVALSELQGAVSRGALASNKVGTWMRRIFESTSDMENITAFLSGKGKNPLSKLISSWDTAKKKFDTIEQKRKQGKTAAGFHFVTKEIFLNWHYAARLAYIDEAENRLQNDKFEGNELLWDIRREMDMKDWDHAEWLMQKSHQMNLSAADKKEIQSMKKYLQTQRAEDSIDDKAESDESSDSPAESLYSALHELEQISPGVRKLYEKAARRGFKAVSGLNALMYNRCWIKQNYTDKFEKERAELREEAKKQTEQELIEGDTGDHKMAFVPTGGKQAIRDYNGEWTSQVLFVNSDNNRQDEILSKCETSNTAFRYWTSLYVDGVDFEQQTHVVSVGRKVKSAMRNGSIHNVIQARAEENSQSNAA